METGHEEDKEKEGGISDHRLIWSTYDARVERDAMRKVVDWEKCGLGEIKGNGEVNPRGRHQGGG